MATEDTKGDPSDLRFAFLTALKNAQCAALEQKEADHKLAAILV